jgi:uncharacterized OB-fold protein
MGLFEEAGRQFERFKQQATDAAEATTEQECEACGARIDASHEHCPECGAETESERDAP